MSKVGDILKSLRVKESLTQEELAKILKMPRSTIGMYEQGKRVPPTEVLEEFADFYNVDMNYITGQTDEEYYLDLQARQIAQEIKDNPDLKILFDASRNVSKEDMEIVKNLVLSLKKKEKGGD